MRAIRTVLVQNVRIFRFCTVLFPKNHEKYRSPCNTIQSYGMRNGEELTVNTYNYFLTVSALTVNDNNAVLKKK